MRKRGKIPLSKAKLRSAISNGKHVLAGVDHRGPEMRRLKDLLAAHVSDLGGPDVITHAEKLLVGRASMLAALLEMQEVEFVRAKLKIKHPSEYQRYLWSVGMLNRVLSTLGLQRRSRDVTPTVDEYLRQQEEQEQERENETAAE